MIVRSTTKGVTGKPEQPCPGEQKSLFDPRRPSGPAEEATGTDVSNSPNLNEGIEFSRIVLETAVLVTLCGLILSATMVTLVQIDKDMILTEMTTPTESLLQSHY